MPGRRRVHRPGPLSVVAASLGVSRLVLAVPIGYLTVLTASAWVATARRSDRAAGTATRFAVLIPAHDEEAVIGDTLAALAALDYPTDLCSVHVVADHCTDRTVEVATAAGADVRENTSGSRGKGPALQWLLGAVLDDAAASSRPIDAIVIVDADTVVAPGFLGAVAAQLEAGATVVQGQYRVRDPGASTATALRSAALALRHHLRPLGRTALGGSCGLFGNGMAFRTEVLRTRAWSDHLTEDIELQNELLLDGVLVAYAPGRGRRSGDADDARGRPHPERALGARSHRAGPPLRPAVGGPRPSGRQPSGGRGGRGPRPPRASAVGARRGDRGHGGRQHGARRGAAASSAR